MNAEQSWSYRVIVRDGQHGIYKVLLAADGHVAGHSQDPVCPLAETIEDLAAELKSYERALHEPVLDYRQLESEAEQRRQTTG